MNHALNVTYPPTEGRSTRAIIDHNPRNQIDQRFAHDVLTLLTRAYTSQFEDAATYDCPLPAGAIEEAVKPDDRASIRAYIERALGYVDHYESQYWTVTYLQEDGQSHSDLAIPGLIKVSPSLSNLFQKANLLSPNMYVNDIIVDPSVQHMGVGSMLLHAALSHAGFKRQRSVALDGFKGSSVNRWFESLGFIAGDEVGGLQLGEHTLPQTRYSSEGNVSIGGIIARLEEQRPWLAEAKGLAA